MPVPLPSWQDAAPHLVDVAMGRAPADMVITNGRWVNVHSGEIIAGHRRRHRGRPLRRRRRRTSPTASAPDTRVIDAAGRYLVPGLCDGHMHVESGMVTVTEFCRAVIPHGTTSMFIDPHEIANVLGLAGRAADARRGGGDADQRLRADAELRARARPGLENAGATIDEHDVARGDGLAQHHRARRDDELPRRRGERPQDAGRDRRHPARRQDRRRPLCLARPRPAVPRLCRGRAGRRPRGHARRGRDRPRAAGHARHAAARLGLVRRRARRSRRSPRAGSTPRNFILCTDDSPFAARWSTRATWTAWCATPSRRG